MPGSVSAQPSRRRRLVKRLLIGVAVIVGLVMVLLVAGRIRATRGLSELSLELQGRERTFFVHLPPGHSKDVPVPLVIMLHGGGGVAAYVNSFTRFSLTREADARGWVLLIPQGIAKGWNDGRPIIDRGSRARAGVDDVAFISALIDYAHLHYGIDEQRVFVTGISNGGAMSFRLGVDLSDRIRAIAPVTMGLPVVHEKSQPKRPISVLIVNGTDDPLVPYAGGQIHVLGQDRGAVLSTAATVDWWAEKNGCSKKIPPRALPDTDPSDGTTVSVEAREECTRGTHVVLYRVEGGGHTWPGGRQYLPRSMVGRVSQDIDASKVIFDFFAEHAK